MAAVEAFRGSGPSDEQGAAILAASVAEYDVGDETKPHVSANVSGSTNAWRSRAPADRGDPASVHW